jgi:hypothetical protein
MFNRGKTPEFIPAAEDYDDSPEDVATFRAANTQFETGKALMQAADLVEGAGLGKFREAKGKFYRDRSDATEAFEEAKKKLKECRKDFIKSQAAFEKAAEEFKRLEDCQWIVTEAKFLRSVCRWKTINANYERTNIKITSMLQFRFEDVINGERAQFARKWKTYFEKSGGILGISGYLTIFNHYSPVAYLHIFMLFPLAWMMFGYHKWIDVNDLTATYEFLFDLNNIMQIEETMILPLGVTVLLFVLFRIFHLFLLRRTSGKSVPRRDTGIKPNWSLNVMPNFFVLLFLFLYSMCLCLLVSDSHSSSSHLDMHPHQRVDCDEVHRAWRIGHSHQRLCFRSHSNEYDPPACPLVPHHRSVRGTFFFSSSPRQSLFS